MRRILVPVLVACFLSVPFAVSALTSQERTTLILQLVQQVIVLNQKIAELGGSAVSIPPALSALAQGSGSAGGAAACTIDRTLALGARGDDVRCLQQFLIQQGLLTPDSATGFFGPLTEKAVQRFQAAQGIASSGTPATTGYGLVGRLTRAALAARWSHGTMPPDAGTTPPASGGRGGTGAGDNGSGGGGSGAGGGGGGVGGGTTPPAPAPSASGYDIIIIAGQSNAVGAGMGSFTDLYANTATDARIVQFGRYSTTVSPATWTKDGIVYDALQHWGRNVSTTTMGFAIPFARRYIAEGHLAPGRQVLIVPGAYAGTSILQWIDGPISFPPSSLYNDLLLRARFALSLPGDNRVVAVLWHQGEADVFYANQNMHGMNTAVYQQQLTALIQKFRTDFPSNPAYPIIAGNFVAQWDRWSSDLSLPRQFEHVIETVLAPDVRAGVVTSTGLTQNYPTFTSDWSEQLHFTAQSQVTLGDRYYQMWKKLINNPTPPSVPTDTTPPVVSLTAPTSSTVSGTVSITATASDPSSPSGQAASGVTGVQFKLDGTNLGTEDTAAPYSVQWNTAATTNGTHVIQAVARDAAGNQATSTATILVANPSGFHCYFTNGIRICHNAANEAAYLSVPNANVAYNISTVRDGNTYYTVYHSEHKGAVAPEGGDSIQSGVTTGTYTGLMPAHDFRLWGNDITDSTLAWYSIDAAGNRVSGPGGGGNPIVISGLPGDPYFYVFFLGVADDDRDRIRGEADWRHYLIQARTQNFITYDLKTDSGWKPFSTATADTIRPAILTDAAGAALRSNAPKAMGSTQGLIGSMSYVNGTYHFFYGDYTPDGLSYSIYHRTTTNLATGAWSAPEVLFARGTDPKNRTMVRIAKAEGMDRWLVLYGCYVTMLDGIQRQDVCLQYTNNLNVTGQGGLSSLSLTPNFALGFSDLASRSFAQPNLLTDRWGNQAHVNSAVDTGEFYWSDYLPSQCSADPRPGCPVYGGDVLRGGWNVKVM